MFGCKRLRWLLLPFLSSFLHENFSLNFKWSRNKPFYSQNSIFKWEDRNILNFRQLEFSRTYELSYSFESEPVNEIVEVTGFDPVKLDRLRVMELRGNKLMTTVGLSSLPNLKELYLVRFHILLVFFVKWWL